MQLTDITKYKSRKSLNKLPILQLAIGNIISTIKKTNPEKVNSLIYDFEVSLKMNQRLVNK